MSPPDRPGESRAPPGDARPRRRAPTTPCGVGPSTTRVSARAGAEDGGELAERRPRGRPWCCGRTAAGLLDPLAGEGMPGAGGPGVVEEPLGGGQLVGRALGSAARPGRALRRPGRRRSPVTRPSSRASLPLNVSAVIVSRLAVSMPTSSARLRTPDMSGMIPHLPSSTDHVESGWAMRKSAASAICRPPPRQWPCTAAMTGTGSRRHAQQASWKVLVPAPRARHEGGRDPGRLPHHGAEVEAAQKASPSPSMTTARTDLSRRSRRAVSISSLERVEGERVAACRDGRAAPARCRARWCR